MITKLNRHDLEEDFNVPAIRLVTEILAVKCYEIITAETARLRLDMVNDS